jgi:hypothetical protein
MKRFAARLFVMAGVAGSITAAGGLADAITVPPGAGQANHAHGYVCEVVYYPNAYPTLEGNWGVVYADFYSGTNCSGTYLAHAVFCTLGAQEADCAPSELYDEQQALALTGWLQHAATSQEAVDVWYQRGGQNGFNKYYGVELETP